MKQNKITIAIDGLSSTGKSTIAKQLARKLGYIYVDTGAMYRAITYFALQKGYIKDPHIDEKDLIQDLEKIDIQFVFNKDLGFGEVHLNGHNVEQHIRSMEVSAMVSPISAIGEVRKKLVALQQKMGKDKGVVMDGRDIGTVVFPNAELKLFLTASAKARATRRYKELLDKGESVSYEAVLENVQKRDHLDSTRSISPLKQAKDAVPIDNSDMGLEEQFERILSLVKRKLKA
ncbi:MAG: (d)CMP kinase [Flavobacteriaceae bacterium]|nr:(d)CMP kinase [Flavobacteriaceae bacterium]